MIATRVSEFSRKRSLEDGDEPHPKRVKTDTSARVSKSAPLFVPDDTPTVVENCTQDVLLFRNKIGQVKKDIARNARLYALLNDSIRGFEEKAYAKLQGDWDEEMWALFAED